MGEREWLSTTLLKELRRLAAKLLQGERSSPTFTASDLVGEACARVLASSGQHAVDKASLRALVVRSMRQALVDRARAISAQKRIPRDALLSLDALNLEKEHWDDDVLLIDELVTSIERELGPRTAKAVELRMFGGLATKEIAQALDTTPRTVQRDLAEVQAWIIAHAKGRHGR